MAKQNPKNLAWMDLEMTGLDPDTETILEIAVIITDGELNVIEEGPSLVIHQEDEILNRMDEWNRKQHSASGLIRQVKDSQLTLAGAEEQILAFIKYYCPPHVAPLCGNSIGQDRKFLYKYMRQLHDYLHYRNIDVTSIKELVSRWYPNGPKPPKKGDSHMALKDVRESVEELIFYRQNYFIPVNHKESAKQPSGNDAI